MANLGGTKGFERFAEFGETLKRWRTYPMFRPIDDKFRTFETQVSAAQQPRVTLDAIEAARERGDSSTVIRGFESLAERGDQRAAQTLGIFYLNGQYVNRNPQSAFAIARQFASRGQESALQRAAANYTGLSRQMNASELTENGCMKWGALHDKFRQFATAAQDIKLRDAPKLPNGSLFDTKTIEATLTGNAACNG